MPSNIWRRTRIAASVVQRLERAPYKGLTRVRVPALAPLPVAIINTDMSLMNEINDSGLQYARARLIELESDARNADLVATRSGPIWTDFATCEITSPRVTARFNYFATGEGVTCGVGIFTVINKFSLEACVAQKFGSFFLPAVVIACGIHTAGFDESDLIPDAICRQLAEYLSGEFALGNFHFAALQHQNLA